jgi:hypothetical protein
LRESTFFEKRNKNVRPFGVRVEATLTHYKQKFFGAFSQKYCCVSSTCRAFGGYRA